MVKDQLRVNNSIANFPNIGKSVFQTKEAAVILGVGVPGMRRYGRLGIIKPIKIGRKYYYDPSDLIVWLLTGRPTSVSKLLESNPV